ncbi:farnesyl diphosphate synthase [uncultured Solobacterium sp.]|uniref:polyprenyl synthetase family protein n=1 Tax=uncultured Solobacterium sp. TaxID=747375 RepID=UPI0028DBB7BE|nr:farnesyl diphosphate synthase [uncultured Solobacterium sp.]
MQIESLLENYINSLPDSTTKSAMLYSLTAGGKRIRPHLLYTVLKGYSVNPEIGNPFACALEMIHTYSLIHDDLPAMDNDDLRRGLPTCHKQFDEATAILAGDGLLTYAFEVAASSNEASDTVIKCISILSQMAGPSGMVYGQQLDLEAENKEIDWNMLQRIHEHKTGCLLTAPLLMGCMLAKHEEDIPAWKKIGFSLGLAFQVQDDILDIELTAKEFGKSNSDQKNHKGTSVSILGIERAKEVMNDLYQSATQEIRSLTGFESAELLEYIHQIQQRRK